MSYDDQCAYLIYILQYEGSLSLYGLYKVTEIVLRITENQIESGFVTP